MHNHSNLKNTFLSLINWNKQKILCFIVGFGIYSTHNTWFFKWCSELDKTLNILCLAVTVFCVITMWTILIYMYALCWTWHGVSVCDIVFHFLTWCNMMCHCVTLHHMMCNILYHHVRWYHTITWCETKSHGITCVNMTWCHMICLCLALCHITWYVIVICTTWYMFIKDLS